MASNDQDWYRHCQRRRVDMRITDRIQAVLHGPQFEMSTRDRHRYDEPIDQTDERSVRSADRPTSDKIAPNPEQFDAKRFILGGNAIVTIEGKSTRYTFKITASDGQNGQIVHFIGLLTGPSNVDDYTYVGILDLDHGTVRLTRKSKMASSSGPVKAFDWVVGRVWKGTEITPAKIYHAGRCGRCGRVLTVPASIESGFGPECLGKLEGV
jgi:hypothetical protein